jgi:phenylalanyl-tRNA synthetase beta subunit
MSKVTTYTVDKTMEASIEKIRDFLGATSNAEVIRRSIALMNLAVDSADEKKRIELMDKKENVLQRVPLAP